MKLLFFTRKIDPTDPRAGFVCGWVEELARQVDWLYVLTWQKSKPDKLPKNVKLIQLPQNKFLRIIILQIKLLAVIPRLDGVFTHMMPIYAWLAGPFCKIFKKKLFHWYTHKSVDWRLRLANFFVIGFVSASRESFRLQTKKPVYIFGHGINLQKFKRQNAKNKTASQNAKFTILTIGRISPSKNYETIIKAIKKLKLKGCHVCLQIVGDYGLESQKNYLQKIKKLVQENNLEDQVKFLGPVIHELTPELYNQADLFINLSDTGSLDKAVLEAMACECLVLTSNEAFKNIIPNTLFVENKSFSPVAESINNILHLPEQEKNNLRKILRKTITNNHNLKNLIKRIVGLFRD